MNQMNKSVTENISKEDRKVLRNLGKQVAELAACTTQSEKRQLWYRHNALEDTRPMIFCDPENGWNEIISEDKLQCWGELARRWEMRLHKEIFWGKYMGDDRVIESYFDIPYSYKDSGWGLHEKRIGGEHGGAYRWEPPLKDYNDMYKLRFPQIMVDYKKTKEIMHLAQEIFYDFLTVRLKGMWWWTLGLTWTLVNLRGLEQSMMDMYDNPNQLHELMGFLRDGTMSKLHFLENKCLLSLNNDGSYVGSGGFGYTNELPRNGFTGNPRIVDMWGFAESQETTSVSPEMFQEFIFPYQLSLLEQFGLNCYGCCEPLDQRWHIIERIPRLRRVSVSPWANLADMAEKLGPRYIYSMKPNPADLARPQIDEEYIRKNLREALNLLKVVK